MMRNLKVYTYVTLVFSVILLGLSLSTAFYGFDFSDEGFYLNWISRPHDYVFSTTQFGFIYYPFYLLAQGEIAWLRFFNLLFTVILAYALFWTLFESPRIRCVFGDNKQGKLGRVASSLFFSSFVLLSFRLWLLSPNYNTLNFQALLLVLIGVYKIYSDQGRRFFSGSLIVVGGCLCFMAKPTTALLLGVIVVGQILLCSKSRWKELLWIASGALILTVILASAIDGNPVVFLFERIPGGLAYVNAMAGHSLRGVFRIDTISWSFELTVIFCLTIGTTIGLRMLPETFQVKIFAFTSLLAIALFLGLSLGFLKIYDYLYVGVFVFGPVVGIFALVLGRLLVRRRDLLFAVCSALYAYAYALGSGNNYWLLISGASVFVIFGLLHVALADGKRDLGWTMLVPLASVSQLLSVLAVGLSILYPYRQNVPLFLQREKVRVGNGDLFLSGEASEYLRNISGVLLRSGFKEGDPMVDMTGHYPGVLFVVKAKPVVHPWILGGYPGSDSFFKQGLLQTKCEDLARAWLLIEKDGPRPISAEALGFVGLNLQKDYEVVGTVDSLLEEYETTFTQVVYRPFGKRPEDLVNCRK
ncbi:hypothetical protein ACES2J_07765 [Bdellovibrio bacteriovorus]|uniref:hypothetical protein n=1 Tax=Bdellovibrio bacteriovorus TaxID=959 RepID=UPI0035A60407